MKRETTTLVKFLNLQRILGLEKWQAVGLLQSIWDFAAINCKAGDIGRFSNDEIALGIGYSGDANLMIQGLVDSHWIDTNDNARLIIHHWNDHCEDYVHLSLARAKECFANGSPPKLTRLSGNERKELESFYSVRKKAHKSAQRAQKSAQKRTTYTMPCHTMPIPSQTPNPNTQNTPLFSGEDDGGNGQSSPKLFRMDSAAIAYVLQTWNAFAEKHGLSRINRISGNRLKHLTARMRDDAWRNSWIKAMNLIPERPFLMGQNDRRWKAHFDWLIQIESVDRLLEGRMYINPNANGVFVDDDAKCHF